MTDTYMALCVIASIMLGFMTSARIAYVLMTRLGKTGDRTIVFVVCGALGAAGTAFITGAALEYGGVMAGLISDFLSVPIVGLVWVYMVGGSKVFERILDRLSARMAS